MRDELRQMGQLPGRQNWDSEDESKLVDVFKEAEAAFEDALLRLSRLYSKSDRPDLALPLMERLSVCTSDPEKKAFCFLSIGQLLEQCRDYDSAIAQYGRALMLEPANNCSWYFIHNNMGCCLNHAERFEEAEQYCREAIQIDPHRYNAYINLGVSLEAQERYIEAARSFLDAMKANAVDLELVEHVEDLLEEHEEIACGVEGIGETLREYRRKHGLNDC